VSAGTDRRSVRVEPELWRAASATAALNGETLSEIMRAALLAYVDAGARVKLDDPVPYEQVVPWDGMDGRWPTYGLQQRADQTQESAGGRRAPR
jgi:hypothetical protein